MNTTKCNGCGFVVNTDPCQCNVIPPQYPYNRPARDSYTFCCCGGTTPPINQYPSAGPFVGSAFMMNDGDPFLMDSTQMTYGAVLSYSESVYTHISKRDDLSCINLAAVFDMTDTSLTNTVRNDFLKQYISRKYMELSGVLPIVKTTMKFRIYYTIRDLYGGTLEQRHCDTNVTDSRFHFTDIRDRYVQSAKGLVIENIPAITYQGLYNITIDRIEIRMGVIDTKQHLVDAMNPFYQFTDNNQRITLQSETIKNTPQDSEIVVATCEVNKSFDYQANVTNRLRLTFTAFTSLPIACGDTMGIWNALNEPTDAVITQLRNEVTAMEEEIRLLHLKDQEQDDRITALENQVELNKNNISTLTARVTTLESAVASKDAIINSILARLDALESIHHALVHYETGKQFYMAQLTWRHHGELFQATRDFIANGSFDTDLANGNLVPVQSGDIDMSAIIDRLDTVEQTANDADSLATETATTVDNLSTSIASLDTRVSALEEKDLSKNKLVVKNLDTNVNQYVDSWSAAADILKADNDGAYKIYPGEGFDGTEIANSLFQNVASLKEIEFVQNTTIGNKAFYQSGLTSLTLDGKINSVGSEICYKCLSLTTLVINKATLDIGSAAFSGCTNLTNVSLPAVDRLETSAFYNIGATTLSVPHYCGYINTGCFNKCENLTSITINAESIADHIFNSSTNLQTVELLENVRYINSSCFEGCPTPLTVNIHKSEGSISGAPWGAGAGVTINWGVN
jgi:hypothetical protein